MSAMLALVSAGATGCRGRNASRHLQAKSENILLSLCLLVKSGESETEEPVPSRLPELTAWLHKHVHPRPVPTLRYKGDTLVDAWDSPLVVISEDNKFVGVGSPGPDRAWQGGSGDDIVVKLADVK